LYAVPSCSFVCPTETTDPRHSLHLVYVIVSFTASDAAASPVCCQTRKENISTTSIRQGVHGSVLRDLHCRRRWFAEQRLGSSLCESCLNGNGRHSIAEMTCCGGCWPNGIFLCSAKH